MQACYTSRMDGTGLYPLPETPPAVTRGSYRLFGAFRLILALMVVLRKHPLRAAAICISDGRVAQAA